MAIIRGGPLAEAVSGSVGGLVFKNGRGARVVGRRPLKVTKDSIASVGRIAQVQMAGQAWAALDDETRQQWVTLAAQIEFTNRLGKPYHLSGRSMFLHQLAFIAGVAISDRAVVPAAVRHPTPYRILQAFSVSGSYNSRIYPYLDDADIQVVWFGARSVSDQPLAAPQYWRFLRTSPSTSLYHNLKTAWIEVFGPVVEGEWAYTGGYFWSLDKVRSARILGRGIVLA